MNQPSDYRKIGGTKYKYTYWKFNQKKKAMRKAKFFRNTLKKDILSARVLKSTGKKKEYRVYVKERNVRRR